MKHVQQGNQHVLVLDNLECEAMQRMVSAGHGDSPGELGMTSKAEKAVWERLTQWAFNGEIPE